MNIDWAIAKFLIMAYFAFYARKIIQALIDVVLYKSLLHINHMSITFSTYNNKNNNDLHVVKCVSVLGD